MPQISYLRVVKLMAFIFLSLVAFFTVQPLISSQRTVSAMLCCPKMMKCHKEKHPSGDNRKCESDGCNPFMACAYGNFYLLEKSGFNFLTIVPEIEKKAAINDNRLSTRLSDCWHPPEFALLIS